MEGFEGWDDYAPFYDWENARTLGRRDVPFWRHLALQAGGPVLELGCGTGRISVPLARAGVQLTGIDRSAPMLAFAQRRLRRVKRHSQVSLIQGDIRHLPFPTASRGPEGPPLRSSERQGRPLRSPGGRSGASLRRVAAGLQARKTTGFGAVIAPYGILQSLLRERDLSSTLAEVHRVLQPGGTFGLELVADLPSWEEYRKRVSLQGWRGRRGGAHVTLVESVRQDPARQRTIFDQEFTERRNGRRRVHRFSLAFRTLSVPQMRRRLERAGFEIAALLGDYRGRAWDARADIWLILARKRLWSG
jgi:ubiquinone/menaquinone biosynthesis C-methylase UbiE